MLVHISSHLFMDFAIHISLPPVIASWLTANVLTSLWASLNWSPSSSTVHSNRCNHNVKTTRVCCLMRTCRVALVYKARIKHEWIKKKTVLRREIIEIVSDNVVTDWSGKQGYINFFICHSLTEQAVVGELKRISANPHRNLYLTKYYRKYISGAKDLSKNDESLDKTIFQKVITLHVKSYQFNNCGKKNNYASCLL